VYTGSDNEGHIDSKRVVSLESFQAAHRQSDIETVSPESRTLERRIEIVYEENGDPLSPEPGTRKRKGPMDWNPRKRFKLQHEDSSSDLRTIEMEFEAASGKRWVSSSKIDMMCKILEGIREEDRDAKVIVFSQVSPLIDGAKEVHRSPETHRAGIVPKEFPVCKGRRLSLVQ
jgi:hypothetical protein